MENTSSAGTYISWNINTGSERYLTSRKSIDDPSTGDFSYKIDMKGLPQLVVVMGASAINGLPAPADSMFNTVMELHDDEWYY
ncbi:G-type lectin S-receptor-like serine/threonine-protein kinase [Pyrus ussuriensis x Pyrus communis]|uniref:G-type lectin S-receptor-like serine/threonine-protein kinase n=1 Tax=Pyrus ussuriensis x Pyrus communis TaxID=2448454 RepID=A0A5N5FRM4_9ROSA|nr:G-type lectin S-receptor-like serine/threonine-protein kinase [Pyrus ussuriensis x Pyrus communis]